MVQIDVSDTEVHSSKQSGPSSLYSRDEIEAALCHVLASNTFLRSERLSRFLSYTVHQTLNGNSADLKEYHLGVAVCGRKDGYDPRTDPVVRVEARRLRAALDLYYAQDGSEDLLHIGLPKGGYVPSFTARAMAPASAAKDGTPIPRPRRWRRGYWIALAALLALATAACTAYLRNQRRPQPFGNASTLVLADFTNTTGEPIFDDALRQGLSAQLEQSPYLSLLPDSQAAQTLALMGKPQNARLTADLAREVCQRTGKSVVIDGSIALLGNQYVLGLSAIDCHTGAILADEQMQANGKEHVIEQLARGASSLRRKLGESLASVQKYDAPPENVTTPSLEALQAYSLGFQVHVVQLDESAAAQLFQRAIAIDPNFAMAYARLAVCNINLGEARPAEENLRKAYALREHVSEHERLFIVSLYHEFVTGDLEEARKTYELRAEVFPHDDIPIGNAGNLYFLLGQYDKALAATQEAIRRNPGSRIWNGNLVSSYLALGRLQEAKSAASAAAAHQLDSPWLHVSLYLVAYEEGDQQAMTKEAAQLKGADQFEDILLNYQAQAKAREGKLNESRTLSRQAVQMALHEGQRDTAALYLAQLALDEAWLGIGTAARTDARHALQLSASRDAEAVAGVALALAGDAPEALRLAADLENRLPTSTLVRGAYVPMLRAAAALHGGAHAGKSNAVFAEPDDSAPIEFGSHALERVAFLTCYTTYFRGEAYLARNRGAQAAAEFRKILDHPQLTLTDPVGAMALLGLARAEEMAGNHPRSQEAYRRLAAIWKNADAGTTLRETLATAR
ncbi:MAG TPA: tetratricopeptide repeat protein [Terracidiphilus sp.]|nr:tetratricopeptide repeat protein [Terracidiphilus sp.]